MPATLQLAATTLRAMLGKMELDEILAHRDRINDEIRTILDTRTEQWGVEISAVEIKDIQLPREMQRAMARQAEAERERRAKVIAAEGEVQAAAQAGRGGGDHRRPPGGAAAAPVPDAGRGLGRGLVDDRVAGADRSRRAAARGASPQQMQTMMQSAVALAAGEKAKQLAAAQRRPRTQLPAGRASAPDGRRAMAAPRQRGRRWSSARPPLTVAQAAPRR